MKANEAIIPTECKFKKVSDDGQVKDGLLSYFMHVEPYGGAGGYIHA